MQTITLIPGDGIGPEIVTAVRRIFDAAQVPILWDEHLAGQTALEATGELLPQALLDSIQENKIALKGPVATPVGKGFRSINVQLRKNYDLYQNVRPAYSIPGVQSRYENVDIVLFRENTEGLYSGLEIYDPRLGIADAVMRITEVGSARIVRAAFDYAVKEGRSKVTLFHKANILKHAHGIFLRVAQEIAEAYPGIEFEDSIIDAGFMHIVRSPERYDVIVTSNMFGDILSDLLAGMVGGLGVVSGANIGDEFAIFEAVHGTAPDIAGQGIANPTGLLLSATQMLRHIGLNSYAEQIQHALLATLSNPANCTGDLGGSANTQTFADNIITRLKEVSAPERELIGA